MIYEHVIKNVSTGETTVVPFTEAEIAAANAANKKSELAALLDQYKADISTIRTALVAALLADGSSEATKISALRADIVTLQNQYTADVAAVKLKYA